MVILTLKIGVRSSFYEQQKADVTRARSLMIPTGEAWMLQSLVHRRGWQLREGTELRSSFTVTWPRVVDRRLSQTKYLDGDRQYD
jgi:hypothetical protein